MICITVNQEEFQFPRTSTIQDVLQHLGIQANGIAVALNHTVIAKNHWSSQALVSQDSLLIIKATQGG